MRPSIACLTCRIYPGKYFAICSRNCLTSIGNVIPAALPGFRLLYAHSHPPTISLAPCCGIYWLIAATLGWRRRLAAKKGEIQLRPLDNFSNVSSSDNDRIEDAFGFGYEGILGALQSKSASWVTARRTSRYAVLCPASRVPSILSLLVSVIHPHAHLLFHRPYHQPSSVPMCHSNSRWQLTELLRRRLLSRLRSESESEPESESEDGSGSNYIVCRMTDWLSLGELPQTQAGEPRIWGEDG